MHVTILSNISVDPAGGEADHYDLLQSIITHPPAARRPVRTVQPDSVLPDSMDEYIRGAQAPAMTPGQPSSFLGTGKLSALADKNALPMEGDGHALESTEELLKRKSLPGAMLSNSKYAKKWEATLERLQCSGREGQSRLRKAVI